MRPVIVHGDAEQEGEQDAAGGDEPEPRVQHEQDGQGEKGGHQLQARGHAAAAEEAAHAVDVLHHREAGARIGLHVAVEPEDRVEDVVGVADEHRPVVE